MTHSNGFRFSRAAFAFLAALAALAPDALRAQPVQWTHLSSAYGDLPVPPSSNGQAGLRVIDLDRDGDTDYLITLWDASSIVWYRQVAGTFEPYIIEPLSYNLTHGERFADIDGDGDIDLIFGQMTLGNDIYWWENPYPDYHPSTRWTRRLVRDSGGNFYHDNIWGDFDGDGAEEFISWNQGDEQLLFFEIPGDPKTSGAWPATPIYTWSSAGGLTYRGIDAADMNLDGKIDMIGGGGWFEHTGGTGFVFHQIDPLMGTARQVVGQVIPGGRPEVVAVQELADGPVNLYEWTGS
ncbi:MAG: VCBS repeat-containing protein, partial [Planctomycetes bacterium]|nr:VCBS repeat-containing protein [Planctomycetota bacterium]